MKRLNMLARLLVVLALVMSGSACTKAESTCHLEGCTQDQMEAFFDTVWSDYVEPYVADTYNVKLINTKFVKIDEKGKMFGCTGSYDEQSFTACNNTIFIGAASLWETYQQGGPTLVGFDIAHEGGHIVQGRRGIGFGPKVEQQAYCVAGNWLATVQTTTPACSTQIFSPYSEIVKVMGPTNKSSPPSSSDAPVRPVPAIASSPRSRLPEHSTAKQASPVLTPGPKGPGVRPIAHSTC